MKYTFITASLFALSTLGAAQKPVLFPSPQGLSQLAPRFTSDIKPAAVTRVNRWTKSIPSNCKAEANLPRSSTDPTPRCTMDQMSVFEVWYADCPESWTMCRCNGSPMSEQQILDEFGRLPLNLRAAVRNLIAFPNGGGAYAWHGDVTLWALNPTIMLHEASHLLDQRQGNLNTAASFRNAINADTCWADDYAKSNGENGTFAPWAVVPRYRHGNYVEPWAQAFVLAEYRRRFGANSLPRNPACLQGSLNAVTTQVTAYMNSAYQSSYKAPKDTATTRINSGRMLARSNEEVPDPEIF